MLLEQVRYATQLQLLLILFFGHHRVHNQIHHPKSLLKRLMQDQKQQRLQMNDEQRQYHALLACSMNLRQE